MVDGGDFYEGYYDPKYRWNGWAMPYFTKQITEAMINKFAQLDYIIIYDEKNEQYIANPSVEDDKEIFDKYNFNTIDGKKELYGIGTGCWTWEAYSMDEIKRFPEATIISYDTVNQKVQEEIFEIEY